MAIPGNMLSSVTEMVDPNTSGWTSKLNCAISLGTGGRNGDGCLQLKSTASGEMQARTVSSYPVVPGSVYQVFADASGVTVPERIGIRWLTAANVEVSISWSLTTAAASATWHRIGVADAAPTTAARAQVVVSASPAAANVINYFENFYLGLPIRSLGNLLPFDVESFEQGIAGWVSETNATVAQQAPVVSWSVGWYYSGGSVLAATAVAAGNMAVRTVDQYPVTAGTEYAAYCYLSPPSTSASAWIEMRFYDSSGALLQTTRGTLAPATTGYQRQIVADFAPAGAVTCGIATGLAAATIGQMLRIDQVVITVAPALLAGTVIPYADGSFEQGIARWTKTSGVATLARSTPWGAYALAGYYALTVTSTTATASVLKSALFALPTGAAGLSWRLMVGQDVTAGGWTISRAMHWYDDAGTDLGATSSSTAAAPTPGWWLLLLDEVAPAGATHVVIELTLTATSTNSVIRLDKIALYQALPYMEIAIHEDTASVSLTNRELSIGDLLRVSRVTSDGMRTLVRGPSGLYDGTFVITTDLMVIEDYEAPLGVPVSYIVEVIDSFDGSIQTRSLDAPINIPHDDINMAWLKDPGNPRLGLQVMVQTAPDWQRPIDQTAYVIKGRRNKVVLGGQRQGVEGDLSLFTRSDDERAALHWLLGSGNTLLWQAADGMGVTDMYVSVGQITEARGGGPAQDPWRVWTLPLVEADMPVTTGVNGSAGRVWTDVVAEFATCDDVLATYATCYDLYLDHRIAG